MIAIYVPGHVALSFCHFGVSLCQVYRTLFIVRLLDVTFDKLEWLREAHKNHEYEDALQGVYDVQEKYWTEVGGGEVEGDDLAEPCDEHDSQEYVGADAPEKEKIR